MASFPQNAKEIETDKVKGNVSTWQLTLENRAGAFSGYSSVYDFIFELEHSQIIGSSTNAL